MLGYVWAFIIFTAFAFSAVGGRMPELSNSVFSGCASAVELVISIGGLLCLWTGLMRILEKSGGDRLIGRIISPAISFLFPNLPKNSEARRLLSMNVTANMLGLGNAATSVGLQTMSRLAARSPGGMASKEMITFVVMNTASVQLIPSTIAALRAAGGSASPFDILPAVWLTSICSLAAGLISAFIFSRLWKETRH